MENKKTTETMLERMKFFLDAIDNGKYEPQGYEFTVKLKYGGKFITIDDSSF